MTRDVYLTKRAERQLDECAAWYAKEQPGLGDRWYHGIVKAIVAISDNPERYPFATERIELGQPFREMLFGIGRRTTHRVLFVVRRDRIVVHFVRHVARDRLISDE